MKLPRFILPAAILCLALVISSDAQTPTPLSGFTPAGTLNGTEFFRAEQPGNVTLPTGPDVKITLPQIITYLETLGGLAAPALPNNFAAAQQTFGPVISDYPKVNSSGTLSLAHPTMCVDTSAGPVSLTLPLSIPHGFGFAFKDCTGSWNTNAFTIVPANSTQQIEGNGGGVSVQITTKRFGTTALWNTNVTPNQLDLF